MAKSHTCSNYGSKSWIQLQIERKYFSKLLIDMKEVACATKFACTNWAFIPAFPNLPTWKTWTTLFHAFDICPAFTAA
jgi:hypothetical protein